MGCTDSILDDTCLHQHHHHSSAVKSIMAHYEPNPFEVDRSHYTFQHAIGSGGFGIVQYAVKRSDPDKNKSFAIKSLSKASILKRKSGLVSIFTELKILASISHTFICNSHYAFQDEAYLYLVLDLARGGDLRYNLSASGGRFSETRAKFYIAQVILALEYLHRIGIIHRDVKPENLLLNDDGYIKLADFGVSKVLSAKTGDCRSTSGIL
jgi:serine/threonine protein kinase